MAEQTPTTTDSAAKTKVVLIDDDGFLLELYALKFGKAGYDVTTFTDAEQAVEKLAEGYVPDVIVLDIIMPKMDGLDFLKARQEKKLAQDSVVVVLSNQGAPSDIRAAQALGAHGYIIKATTIPTEVVTEVARIYKSVKTEAKAS